MFINPTVWLLQDASVENSLSKLAWKYHHPGDWHPAPTTTNGWNLKKAPKGKVEKHLPNHQSFLVQNLTFSGCMLLIKDPLQNGCAGPWHCFLSQMTQVRGGSRLYISPEVCIYRKRLCIYTINKSSLAIFAKKKYISCMYMIYSNHKYGYVQYAHKYA